MNKSKNLAYICIKLQIIFRGEPEARMGQSEDEMKSFWSLCFSATRVREVKPAVQVYFSGRPVFLCELFRHHLELLKEKKVGEGKTSLPMRWTSDR